MSQKFTHPQGCKMSSPTKSGSQPCGWQIASSRDSFCDFGRKLETLRMPVRNIVLPWTAAQVLMCPDGAFRTYTSLRPNLNQACLEFLIFGQRKQNSPGLMQFANRNPPEPPYTRKLMSPTNHHLVSISYC